MTRVLAEGKVVLGFGERKTPSSFVNAGSKFLYLDDPETVSLLLEFFHYFACLK